VTKREIGDNLTPYLCPAFYRVRHRDRRLFLYSIIYWLSLFQPFTLFLFPFLFPFVERNLLNIWKPRNEWQNEKSVTIWIPYNLLTFSSRTLSSPSFSFSFSHRREKYTIGYLCPAFYRVRHRDRRQFLYSIICWLSLFQPFQLFLFPFLFPFVERNHQYIAWSRYESQNQIWVTILYPIIFLLSLFQPFQLFLFPFLFPFVERNL